MTVLSQTAITHKGIRLSRDINELGHRSVNLVLVKRPHAAVVDSTWQADCVLARPSLQATLDVRKPEEGIQQLLSSVLSRSLQQQLQQDLAQAVQLFSSTLQIRHLNARLEVVEKQSCPKWHADYVKMRMLCTYAGPGTWCIENRFVEREYDSSKDMFAISAVAEEHRIETAAGDLLFLKGLAYPGMYGAGAVHKSPKLAQGEERLLLTIDDSSCGC